MKNNGPQPPIRPIVQNLKEYEALETLNKCLFCNYVQVRDSGVYMYEQCDRCLHKRIRQIRSGYQPVASGWENVEIS